MSETLKFLFVFPIIIGLAVGAAVGVGSLGADMIRGLKDKQKFFSLPEEPKIQTPPHLRENE